MAASRLRRRRCPGAVVLFFAWVAAAAVAPPAAPRTLIEAPAVTWRHERVWTLSSEDQLFGLVTEVIRLADGTLAVADAQLDQVLLLDGDGGTRRVLDVAGQGPGRLERLTGLAETSAGDLALVQAWPGRVEVIARDGTPRRSLRPIGRDGEARVTSLLRLVTAAGRWLGLLVDVQPGPGRRSRSVVTLAWLDPEDLSVTGAVLRRESVAEARQGFVDETAIDAPRRAWDLLPDGRAVVAPDRAAFALEVHEPRAGFAVRLERPHQPRPRPQAELDLIRGAFRLTVDGRPRPIEFRFFETAAAVQRVVALDDGGILLDGAGRFEALEPGVTARCELVDPEAATVTEVRVQVPCRPWIDALVVLPDRDVVVVRHGYGGLAAVGPGLVGDAAAGGVPTLEYWRFVAEGR